MKRGLFLFGILFFSTLHSVSLRADEGLPLQTLENLNMSTDEGTVTDTTVTLEDYTARGTLFLELPKVLFSEGGILDPQKLASHDEIRVCADHVEIRPLGREYIPLIQGNINFRITGSLFPGGEGYWGSLKVTYSNTEPYRRMTVIVRADQVRDCSVALLHPVATQSTVVTATMAPPPMVVVGSMVAAMPASTVASSSDSAPTVAVDPRDLGVGPRIADFCTASPGSCLRDFPPSSGDTPATEEGDGVAEPLPLEVGVAPSESAEDHERDHERHGHGSGGSGHAGEAAVAEGFAASDDSPAAADSAPGVLGASHGKKADLRFDTENGEGVSADGLKLNNVTNEGGGWAGCSMTGASAASTVDLSVLLIFVGASFGIFRRKK